MSDILLQHHHDVVEAATSWLARLSGALLEFAIVAMVFTAIAVCFHGLKQLRPTEDLVCDSRVNLAFMFSEAVILAPLFAAVPPMVQTGLASLGFSGPLAPLIVSVPFWLQIVLACLVIDGIGYWRHRLMHSRLLWPVHSVHHSDLTVTWLTLARFHPLNRLITTVFLSVGMALIGFPKPAIVAGVLVIHFYGYFLHADIPWRYGALKYVFVSPTLHRWHHSYAQDVKDKNFASLFAFYDVCFDTFVLPDRPVELLGVGDDSYPRTWLGELIHPFRVWLTDLTRPEPLTRNSASGRRTS